MQGWLAKCSSQMPSIFCSLITLHVLQGESVMLQAMQQSNMVTQQLTSVVRQLQSSQAVICTELLQTGTVVRRLQQQGTQSAVMLTSMVCQGLGSSSLAMPSAATAVPAVPLRVAKSVAGRRRQTAEAAQQKQQRQQAEAVVAGDCSAGPIKPKWQRWEGIHYSLDRKVPSMHMPSIRA